jgi:hypothetical protein
MSLRRIWNRICQFGCSCPSCTSRYRVDPKAGHFYRAIRARPFATSTTLYTSLFGIATAIDGKNKKARKEQWDEAIANKKEEVVRLRQQVELRASGLVESNHAISTSTSTRTTDDDDDESLELNKAIAAVSQFLVARDNVTSRRLEQLLQFPWWSSRKPPDIPSLSNIKRWSLPPQSPWAPEPRRRQMRTPWTPKKSYTVELSVARFVLKLFQAFELLGMQGQELDQMPRRLRPYAALTTEEAEDVLQQMELEQMDIMILDHAHVPSALKLERFLPTYAIHLDDSLYENLTTMKIKSLSQTDDIISPWAIAHLADVLLSSNRAPGIYSINQILYSFVKSQQEQLVGPVIDLLNDGHYRPNEVTCACVLRYYRQTNDRASFMEYLGKMRASNGHLMTTNRPVYADAVDEDLKASQGRLVRFGNLGNKMAQAVHPSPITYLEMVTGMVQFVGLQKTWQFCQNLSEFGWGFDFACIYFLLFRAAVEGALVIALDLWRSAERLSSLGHVLPTRLQALMVSICEMENLDTDKLDIFRHGSATHELRILIDERTLLIKQFRIVTQHLEKKKKVGG